MGSYCTLVFEPKQAAVGGHELIQFDRVGWGVRIGGKLAMLDGLFVSDWVESTGELFW